MISQFFQSLVVFFGDHPTLAILIVFLIAAGEAIFVIGLFVPSTVVLVGAGTLVGMGKLGLIPIFTATALGAIAGDAISYWIGHIWKERIRDVWPFNKYTSMLDTGEMFFAKHGGKSIFIGRFIPGVKAVVPGIAGMVGMDPIRFTIINIVSAFAWTAAHLLPAILVGRGIDVAKTSNPKLLYLSLIIAVISIVTWYASKVLINWVVPKIDDFRKLAILKLARYEAKLPHNFSRILANREGVLLLYSYAVLIILALSLFVMIVINLLFDPELTKSDAAVSAYIQSLRNDTVEFVMVGTTMLGDGIVLIGIATILIFLLLWHREWKMGLSVVAAFTTASIFVPIMKTVLHRAGPVELYSGAGSFNIPSDYATLSTTILGITAIFLTHALPTKWRRFVYFSAALTIVLIAFSKVYLLAHWPSDVLAGIAFGSALVLALALLLHGRELQVNKHLFATVLVLGMFSFSAGHIYTGFADEKQNYIQKSIQIVLTQTEWKASKWQNIPLKRQMLDGENGELMVVQTDIPIDGLIETLTDNGWRQQKGSWVDELVYAMIPSRLPLPDRVALPLTNSGNHPVASLTKIIDSNSRNVLYIWKSDFISKLGVVENPIVTISVTKEQVDPIVFGFSQLENDTLSSDEQIRMTAELTTNLLHLKQSDPAASIPAIITQEEALLNQL